MRPPCTTDGCTRPSRNLHKPAPCHACYERARHFGGPRDQARIALENAVWLWEMGESPEMILLRCHPSGRAMTPAALARSARRAGHSELARALEGVVREAVSV